MKSFKLFYLALLTFVVTGNYNAQCSASSTYSVDSSNCNTILFNAANTGNTFLWTFGDGSTSSSQNPNHVFNANGTYGVVLTVSQVDSSGNVSCTDTSMLSIVINCGGSTPSCTATPTYSVDSTNCYDVSFQAPAGYSIYQWSFGDGSTSSSQNPMHTFAGNGTYNVGLSVALTDSSGYVICDDSTYISVIINCGGSTSSCTATPTYSVDSANCYNVSFQAPAGYSIYQWNFGDGSTSTSQNPTHTFAGNGTYSVGLSVMLTDSSGSVICDDSTYISVIINCGGSTSNCDASFNSFADSSNCLLYNFSTNTQFDTYSWDFGDGNYSNTAYPSHTYGSNGTYNVTLVGYQNDSSGNYICGDTVTIPLTITCVTAIEELSTFSINTYPNPFVGELNVTIEANDYQEVEISITSISGAVLNKQVYQLNNGTNRIQMNQSDLSSGIYLLNIKNLETNINSVQRIIKQ